ncbi:MAG: 16S rRNA (adenine(1518)-N(6)/adenine(1519)-N(6))-dimethyltransferase RsmA [Candidatus Cloacimonadales bacterium]|nr:16S rRNA (adenine(1518)-N(6)/adenine(1519)-N(6))-dimethyltransferase RsmA [Candidatus Cloacimonadota bacterium]MDY0380583.1 16S rRNA (adenine(1518)-N(6)/adenine(1519)-N(6))-dimethyltransferase RsmA [Candidatus Cloacimonadaceae bacterium]HCM15421.1 ribosomal RNA small subunit methyltransferase A [Candidatus Cloacimonas sp.]MCB5256982.1 16S rRNA (adenine(1518)-N(6)/adenine(1519)-N(6))-dimethyltransferase RsmA [Candidatus Cloacimonadota bacterium]MCB5263910.1 16S rRNA (adenine(1518)-N(6)/adenin
MKAIKELGQHFLNDPALAAKIADLGEISPGERIWEIGPGPGILTNEILSRGATLEAFELDKRMASLLYERFGGNLELVITDILKLNWAEQIATGSSPIKVIANIPYQITSPLLYMIQEHSEHFRHLVLMVQKEVAERLSAKPGKKDYGPLTIKLGLCYEIHTAFMVGRECFDPVPKVDSAVITLRARTDSPSITNPHLFYKVLTAAFAHRRKTLRNNLIPLLGRDEMQSLEQKSDIDFNRRAETLDEKEFIRLSDIVAEL